ncbi:flagellar export chaperone FliS [Salirhabdus salicampi]|uniref:flagellar export chaperone FliS n=1 Tax=Salirhabdus salicampi TaxID=476102 RepID=UPI0020C1C986|nr:flagellar export chaperone FliS [Salirhabdus salicampi]MCP8617608.1 flagellar export chaperone FliS [Salirhabdus salicampi]
MAKPAYEVYQNQSMNTASPGELTLKLYNGCLKFIKLAKEGIENKDFELKNTNIQKSQRIIQELMITLDPSYEITNEMLPLYEYIHHRLMEANVNNDIKALEEAAEFVAEFRDAWKQVLLINRKAQYGEGGKA